MRHILIVGVSPDMQGGIASVLRTYRDGSLAKSWHLHFIQTAGQGSTLRKLAVFILGYLRFACLCATKQVSLVHVHSASGLSFWRKSLIVRSAKLAGVPSILHLHGGNLANFLAGLGPLANWWARGTLNRATRVVTLTSSWRDVVAQAAPGARVAVIPNGVTLRERAGAERVRDVVLFVGRLEAQKGVYDLLEAFSRLGESHGNLRLVLAGTGESSIVADRAERLGVRDRVDLVGWADESARDSWMLRARVFVLPSHFEGMPVSVLEAMSLGAPVLATCVGGIPDIVVDGMTGRLVEVANPIALSVALSSMLNDRFNCDAMANRAKCLVRDKYSVERVSEAVETLYLDLTRHSRAMRDEQDVHRTAEQARRCVE